MYKPDIIGITEILPKNREEDPERLWTEDAGIWTL